MKRKVSKSVSIGRRRIRYVPLLFRSWLAVVPAGGRDTRRSYRGSGGSFSGHLANMSREIQRFTPVTAPGRPKSCTTWMAKAEATAISELRTGVVIFRPTASVLVSILRRRCTRPLNSPAAPRLSNSRRSTLPRYHRIMYSSAVRRKEQKFISSLPE